MSFFIKRLQAEDNNRAVTLIELIVVMVIISVIAVTALPSFSRLFKKSALDASIRDVSQTLIYAHHRAVFEEVICRVNFDIEGRRYWISLGDQASGRPPARKKLSENITLTRIVAFGVERTSAPRNFITFRPDGTADRYLLYFEDSRGNIYTIMTMSSTGQVKTFNYKYEPKIYKAPRL
ncbi:MAG: prepilin-type N-terminal cleavage/methylation domain-containing protein [Candidatus Omnitrophica bacterium]|nr:prepilin-type N-terminal cleavage/methylation domain-containing protein [Candidatus Omnitrophota bacterium]